MKNHHFFRQDSLLTETIQGQSDELGFTPQGSHQYRGTHELIIHEVAKAFLPSCNFHLISHAPQDFCNFLAMFTLDFDFSVFDRAAAATRLFQLFGQGA